MKESEWFNTSDHSIALSMRMLKAMSDHIPNDPLIKKQMRRLVLEARKQGLTNPTEHQNLVASAVMWD